MGEIKSCKYRRGELLLFSILFTGLAIKVYDLRSSKRGNRLEAVCGLLRSALSTVGTKADFVRWEEH